MKRGRLAVLVAAGLIILVRAHGCGERDGTPLAIATFNIENYPKSPAQADGVFEVIASLDVAALAVQEITEPAVFARDARAHLGPSWRFVHCEECPPQRVGVLYDAGVLNLLSTRSYDEPRIYRGAKPAFEARLQPRAGGPVVRLIVVHLKSHAPYADTRRRQLDALVPVLRRARASGDTLILLGDFNTTSAADRRAVHSVAEKADLIWASRDLDCTSYWERRESCAGTPLDHILTSARTATVRAAGACASHGCDPGSTCPAYVRAISDHCPVVAR